MAKANYAKRTRNALLLSMIFHFVMAMPLSLFIMSQEDEKIRESIAVEMVKANVRSLPSMRMRSIPIRSSKIDFSSARKAPILQFESKRITLSENSFKMQDANSFKIGAFPELGTSVDRLKPRFDIALPKAASMGSSIMKPGEGTGKSIGQSGGSPSGLTDSGGIFGLAMDRIARNIVNRNKTGREDIVFLVDASGSMEENIAAVARYLNNMVDIFQESGLDYTIGVIRYNRILKENDITIYDQSKDPSRVRAILRSIRCQGDESTFDALEAGLKKVKFRDPVDKTFILVTDESFKPRSIGSRSQKKSRKDTTTDDFQEILRMCNAEQAKVNVLGVDDELHKKIAEDTGGLWFQIPRQTELP